jgi:hypothetical protein
MKINALGNATSTEQFYANFYTKFNNIYCIYDYLYLHPQEQLVTYPLGSYIFLGFIVKAFLFLPNLAEQLKFSLYQCKETSPGE